MERRVSISRKTTETDISIVINLDGSGKANIDTEILFLNHMLTLFARHGNIDLDVKARGDLVHHLVEDIAIVLGNAIVKALGDKKGIVRYGSMYIPMDETLGFCAIDLSGRPYFKIDLKFKGHRIEDIATEDIIHFFESFALNAKMNLHVNIIYGENDHHKAEAAIKALAHSIKYAIKIDGERVLSTKGTL